MAENVEASQEAPQEQPNINPATGEALNVNPATGEGMKVNPATGEFLDMGDPNISPEGPVFSTRRDLSSYEEQGVRLNPNTMALWDKQRAANQSSWQHLSGFLAQSAAEIVGGGIEGAGWMFEYGSWNDVAKGTEKELGNVLTAAGASIKASARENFPIYKSEEGFAPGTSAFWAEGLVSMSSTLSIMLPVGGAFKLLSLGAKATKIAQGLKAIGMSANAIKMVGYGSKVIGSAGMSRHIEANMEAKQIYDSLVKKYSQTMDPREAKKLAAEGAAYTHEKNWSLVGLDLLQYALMYGKAGKATKLASAEDKAVMKKAAESLKSMGTKAPAEVTEAAAKTATKAAVEGTKAAGRLKSVGNFVKNKTSKSAIADVFGEGFEEFYQGFIGKEAEYLSDVKAGYKPGDLHNTFETRVADSLTDGELWSGAFFGAFGGVAQSGAGKLIAKGHENPQLSKALTSLGLDKEQERTKLTEEAAKNFLWARIIREADALDNPKASRAARDMAHTYRAMDSIIAGKDEEYLGMLEFFSSLTPEDIEEHNKIFGADAINADLVAETANYKEDIPALKTAYEKHLKTSSEDVAKFAAINEVFSAKHEKALEVVNEEIAQAKLDLEKIMTLEGLGEDAASNVQLAVTMESMDKVIETLEFYQNNANLSEADNKDMEKQIERLVKERQAVANMATAIEKEKIDLIELTYKNSVDSANNLDTVSEKDNPLVVEAINKAVVIRANALAEIELNKDVTKEYFERSREFRRATTRGVVLKEAIKTLSNDLSKAFASEKNNLITKEINDIKKMTQEELDAYEVVNEDDEVLDALEDRYEELSKIKVKKEMADILKEEKAEVEAKKESLVMLTAKGAFKNLSTQALMDMIKMPSLLPEDLNALEVIAEINRRNIEKENAYGDYIKSTAEQYLSSLTEEELASLAVPTAVKPPHVTKELIDNEATTRRLRKESKERKERIGAQAKERQERLKRERLEQAELEEGQGLNANNFLSALTLIGQLATQSPEQPTEVVDEIAELEKKKEAILKPKEKGLERLSNILGGLIRGGNVTEENVVKVLTEISRILKNGGLTKAELSRIESVIATAKVMGYEISSQFEVGKVYDDRQVVDVTVFENGTAKEKGDSLISAVIEPAILKDDFLIQRAKVRVKDYLTPEERSEVVNKDRVGDKLKAIEKAIEKAKIATLKPQQKSQQSIEELIAALKAAQADPTKQTKPTPKKATRATKTLTPKTEELILEIVTADEDSDLLKLVDDVKRLQKRKDYSLALGMIAEIAKDGDILATYVIEALAKVKHLNTFSNGIVVLEALRLQALEVLQPSTNADIDIVKKVVEASYIDAINKDFVSLKEAKSYLRTVSRSTKFLAPVKDITPETTYKSLVSDEDTRAILAEEISPSKDASKLLGVLLSLAEATSEGAVLEDNDLQVVNMYNTIFTKLLSNFTGNQEEAVESLITNELYEKLVLEVLTPDEVKAISYTIANSKTPLTPREIEFNELYGNEVTEAKEPIGIRAFNNAVKGKMSKATAKGIIKAVKAETLSPRQAVLYSSYKDYIDGIIEDENAPKTKIKLIARKEVPIKPNGVLLLPSPREQTPSEPFGIYEELSDTEVLALYTVQTLKGEDTSFIERELVARNLAINQDVEVDEPIKSNISTIQSTLKIPYTPYFKEKEQGNPNEGNAKANFILAKMFDLRDGDYTIHVSVNPNNLSFTKEEKRILRSGDSEIKRALIASLTNPPLSINFIDDSGFKINLALPDTGSIVPLSYLFTPDASHRNNPLINSILEQLKTGVPYVTATISANKSNNIQISPNRENVTSIRDLGDVEIHIKNSSSTKSNGKKITPSNPKIPKGVPLLVFEDAEGMEREVSFSSPKIGKSAAMVLKLILANSENGSKESTPILDEEGNTLFSGLSNSDMLEYIVFTNNSDYNSRTFKFDAKAKTLTIGEEVYDLKELNANTNPGLRDKILNDIAETRWQVSLNQINKKALENLKVTGPVVINGIKITDRMTYLDFLKEGDLIQSNRYFNTQGQPFHIEELILTKVEGQILPTDEEKAREEAAKEAVLEEVKNNQEQNQKNTPPTTLTEENETTTKGGVTQEELNNLDFDNDGYDPSFKRTFGKEADTVTNLEEELTWLKANLPNVPVEVFQGLLRVKNTSDEAYGAFIDGMILLSSVAESGTAYHEALHAVMALYLTDNERADVYAEAEAKYGTPTEANLREEKVRTKEAWLEEKLAEGLRAYVMSQGKVKHTKGIAAFFSNLWETIKGIFSKKSVTDKLFNNINRGYYRDSKVVDNTVARSSKYNKVDGVLDVQLDDYVSFLSFAMFQVSKAFESANPTQIPAKFSSEGALIQYIDKGVASYISQHAKITEALPKANAEQAKSLNEKLDMLNSFIALSEKMKGNISKVRELMLKDLDKISFIGDEKLEEEEDLALDLTDDRVVGTHATENSKMDAATAATKLIIKMLPYQEYKEVNGVNKAVNIRSKHTGLPRLVRPSTVWATLSQALSGFVDLPINGEMQHAFPKMLEQLKRLATVKPEMGILADKLEKGSDTLRSQFFVSFSNSKINYLSARVSATGLTIGTAESQGVTSAIADSWKTGFHLSHSHSLSEEDSTGYYTKEGFVERLTMPLYELRKKVDAANIAKQIKRKEKGEAYNKIADTTITDINDVIGEIQEVLEANGINMQLAALQEAILGRNPSATYDNSSDVVKRADQIDAFFLEYLDPIVRNIENAIVYSSSQTGYKTATEEMLYTVARRDGQALSRTPELLQLAAFEALFSDTAVESSVIGPDGKRKYVYTQNNYLSKKIAEMNESADYGLDILESSYGGHSLWAGASVEGTKMKVEVLNSMYKTGEDSDNVDGGEGYLKLTRLEELSLRIHSTLAGRYTTLAHADKSLLYLVKGMPVMELGRHKGDVSDTITDDIVSIFEGYFLDEVNRIKQTYNELYGENKLKKEELSDHYHTGARGGLKSILFPELTIFKADAKGNIINDSKGLPILDGGVSKSMAAYVLENQEATTTDDTIREHIKKALTDRIKDEIALAEDLGFINYDEAASRLTHLANNDFNKHYDLANGSEDNSDGDKRALEHAMATFLVNDLIASVETTKLFTSDPAFYKNLDDFKKRTPSFIAPGLDSLVKKGEEHFTAAFIGDYEIKTDMTIKDKDGNDVVITTQQHYKEVLEDIREEAIEHNKLLDKIKEANNVNKKEPSQSKIADGVIKIENALSKEEEIELFDMLKPYLESQASKTNQSKDAPLMIGLGLRWDYVSNNPGVTPLDIKDIIDKNASGSNRKYGYYLTSIDGEPLGEIPDRLKDLMTKATGVDATNYDGAIINIYKPGSFISAHADIDEAANAIKYPVLVANIGGAGNISMEHTASQKAKKSYSLKEYNPTPLASGDAYIFGKGGVNRDVYHRTTASDGKGTLPALNIKGEHIPANSYRISITLRRVKDLEKGMPAEPAYVNEQTEAKEVEVEDLAELMYKRKDAEPKRVLTDAEIAAISGSYKETNVADAQAYITLARHKQIYMQQGKFDESYQRGYKQLMDNVPINELDEDALLFLQPIKGHYYGVKKDPKTGLMLPTILKYSQAPLYRGIAPEGSPLGKLLTVMERDGIDEAIFESGAKVGVRGKVKAEDVNNMADYSLVPSVLDNRHWKLQQDLPTKYHKKGYAIEGSQVKLHLQGNIDNTTIYGDKTGEEIIEHINDAERKLSDLGRLKVEKKLGIKRVNGLYVITDPSKLNKHLMTELEGEMPDAVIEALSFNAPIDLLPMHQKIQQKILSLVNKNTVKLTMPGGAFIQMSPFGLMEQALEDNGYIMRIADGKGLKPPRFENGEFKGGQIYVPYKLVEEIPGFKTMSPQQRKEAINNIDPKMLRAIGYRIPTQKLSSVDALDIAGVLPKIMGDTIIAYPEITTKTGSDYDIDKMWVMMYSHVDKYDWKGIQSSFMARAETVEALKALEDKGTYEKVNKKGEAYKMNSLQIFKQIINKSEEDILDEAEQAIFDSFMEYKKENKQDFKAGIKMADPTWDSQAGLQNRKLDAYWDILSSKDKFAELITSVDAEWLKDETNAIKKLKEGVTEGVKYQGGSFFANKEQFMTKRMFTEGKTALATTAVHQVDHVKTQISNIVLTSNKISNQYNQMLDNKKVDIIMDTISAFVNGFVDIAKDPYVFHINANPTTVFILFEALRRGENKLEVINKLAQHSVEEYVKLTMSKNGRIKKDSPADLREAVIEFLEDAPSERGFREEATEGDLFSLEGLREELENPSIEGQIAYLDWYIKSESKANLLSAQMLASRHDTKGAGTGINDILTSEMSYEELIMNQNVYYFEEKFTKTALETYRENSEMLAKSLLEKQAMMLNNHSAKVLLRIIKHNKGRVSKDDFKNIENALRSLRYHSLDLVGAFGRPDIVSEYKTEESVMEALKSMQKSTKKGRNALLDSLEVKTVDVEGIEHETIIINGLQKRDTTAKNDITNAWKGLLHSPDEAESSFAHQLAHYALTVSKTQGVSTSMTDFIPPSLLHDIGFYKALDPNATLSEEEYYKHFPETALDVKDLDDNNNYPDFSLTAIKGESSANHLRVSGKSPDYFTYNNLLFKVNGTVAYRLETKGYKDAHGNKMLEFGTETINEDGPTSESQRKEKAQSIEGFDQISSEMGKEEALEAKLYRLQKAFPEAVITIDPDMESLGKVEFIKGRPYITFNSKISEDTAIHEFGHIYIEALGGLDNTLIKEGYKQLEGTQLDLDVRAEYIGYSEDYIKKEVLAQAIGKEGAILFRSIQNENKFMSFLRTLFNRMASLFGIPSNVARRLASEMLTNSIRKSPLREIKGLFFQKNISTLDKVRNRIIDSLNSQLATLRRVSPGLKDNLAGSVKDRMRSIRSELFSIVKIEDMEAMSEVISSSGRNIRAIINTMDELNQSDEGISIEDLRLYNTYLEAYDSMSSIIKDINREISGIIEPTQEEQEELDVLYGVLLSAKEVDALLTTAKENYKGYLNEALVTYLAGSYNAVREKYREDYQVEYKRISPRKDFKGTRSAYDQAMEEYVNSELAKNYFEILQENRSYLEEIMETAPKDTNWLVSLFMDSRGIKDPLIQSAAKLLERAHYNSVREFTDKYKEAYNAFTKFKEGRTGALVTNMDTMYDVMLEKEDGKTTGNLVERYYYTKYEADKRAHREEAYKEGLTDDEVAQKMIEWGLTNTEEIVDPEKGLVGYKPAMKYYNPAFDALLADQGAYEFYELLKHLGKEADSNLPRGFALGATIPKTHKDFTERVMTQSVKDTIMNMGASLKLQKDDTEMGSVALEAEKGENISEEERTLAKTLTNMITDSKGRKAEYIPIFYRGDIKESDRSNDLFGIYLSNLFMSINHREKNLVAAKVESLRDIAHDRDYALDHRGKRATRKDTNSTVVKKGTSETAKAMDTLLTSQLYGISKIDAGDFLGVNLTKVVGALAGYTAKISLTTNYLSAMTNFNQGQIATFLNAVGGRFFNSGDYMKAIGDYGLDFTDMARDFANEEHAKISKTNLLLERFDFMGNVQGYINDMSKDTKLKRLNPLDNLMLFNSMAEHSIQGVLMYALLNNVKVLNAKGEYLTKEGTTTNREEAMGMADAYTVKEGKLVLDKRVYKTDRTRNSSTSMQNNKDQEFEIAYFMQEVNMRENSNYRSNNTNTIGMTILGTMLQSMRSWITRHVQKRFEGISTAHKRRGELDIDDRHYNLAIGEYTEGVFTTLMRYMINVGKSLKEHKSKAFKEEYQNLTPGEESNFKEALGNIAFIVAGNLLASLLASLADDEKEEMTKEFLFMQAYLFRKVYQDTGFVLNLNEMLKTLDTPSMILKTIGNVFAAIGQIPEYDEVYDTGKYAGENKLTRKLTKVIPWARGYGRFTASNEQLYNYSTR